MHRYRILHSLLLTIIAALLTTACSSDSDDGPTPPPAGDEATRTVLVYMVASNNLGDEYFHFDLDDLDEMLKAARGGAIGDGRLLVYYNRYGTDYGKAPQLLEVTADGVEVLKTYPDDPSVYSVEIGRMREVLGDMRDVAPAKGYGLVLWGHAKGWMSEDNDIVEPAPRSYGNDRGKWMSLTSLATALKGERFDFIYLDCCLMGSVEVVYELRDAADVIVGSPTEVEGEGMPYDLNVPVFFDENPDMTLAAKNTYEYHSAGRRNCQMVVVDTGALRELAAASRAIYATIAGFPSELSGLQPFSRIFDRYSSVYGDCRPVYDFESYMQLAGADHQELLAAWQRVYDACVIYKATTPTDFTGIPIRTYGGLGAFVIKKPSDAGYRGYKDTAWWADVASAAPAFN